MPVKQLKDYLDSQHIKYVSIVHSQAYSAQEIAASAHIPGRELAKTVMVRIDDKMAMAVLAASSNVDLHLLKQVAGAGMVGLATEEDFKDKFPGCVIGAMPPFGNLYGMEVYVDLGLTTDQKISFNAGSHVELIQMMYQDFDSLVKPRVGRFSSTPGSKPDSV